MIVGGAPHPVPAVQRVQAEKLTCTAQVALHCTVQSQIDCILLCKCLCVPICTGFRNHHRCVQPFFCAPVQHTGAGNTMSLKARLLMWYMQQTVVETLCFRGLLLVFVLNQQ